MATSKGRTSWLDDEGGVAIDDMARKLESFVQALADGVVTQDELDAQEKRVVELMRRVEPRLDDELHAQVTQLLCELVAFDVMQMLRTAQEARAKVRFRG